MKGWVGLVGWPIADVIPIKVVTHPLQIERRPRKVRLSETDVLTTESLMSHECPPAVRSKLRDQRMSKHARRIWSVDEAVRIVGRKCRLETGTGSAGTVRTNGIRQVLRRVATKDRVHDTAQLELDPPADGSQRRSHSNPSLLGLIATEPQLVFWQFKHCNFFQRKVHVHRELKNETLDSCP